MSRIFAALSLLLFVSVLSAAVAPRPALAQEMPTASAAAEDYRAEILARYEQTVGPQMAENLRRAGVTAFEAKEWSATVAILEKAVAAGAGDHEVWFTLGRALAMTGDSYGAAGAFFAAVSTAATPEAKADSLSRLGATLMGLKQPMEALAAYRGAAAIDPAYEKSIAYVLDLVELRLEAVDIETGGENPRICLNFNEPMLDARQVHYEHFVTFAPAFEARYVGTENQVCIEGADYGQTYELSIGVGLPSAGGRESLEARTTTVAAIERDASLGFESSAYVLPAEGTQGVPLVTVNYDDVELQLLRINDRNLIRQIAEGRFLQASDGYHGYDVIWEQGEEIWRGQMAIANEANRKIVTSVPIDEILPERKPGVYLLTAFSREQQDYDWEPRATQWLIVSDIGLTSFSGEDGLTVYARSLADGEPLRRVTVTLYGRNNEALGETVTDRHGVAQFDPGLLRGERGREPTAIMASRRDGDFAFLDLTQPAFDLSDRGVGGRLMPEGADLFFYADRGAYRPGETVHLMAMMRDASGVAMEQLPLTVRLFRPDGSELRSYALESAGLGGYQLDLPIDEGARTGSWTVEGYLDPEGPAIGSLQFLVEQVVPARIEVELTTDAEAIMPGEEAPTVDIAVDYLYGAPGAGLSVRGEAIVQSATDPFPQYVGYHFALAEERFDPLRYEWDPASTDEDGRTFFSLDFGELPDVPQPLEAVFRAEAVDVGGRAVAETITLPIRNQPLSLGIKPLFGDDQTASDSSAVFEIIAVAPDGSRAAADQVQYRLYREEWDYQWFQQWGQWDYRWVARDVEMTSGELSVAADLPTELALSVAYGRHRLEIYDPVNNVAASYRFTAGWYALAGTGTTPDNLELTADKESYRPGEKAKFFLRPPFDGQVLIAIATDRVLDTRVMDATTEGVEFSIPIEETWGAGAYVLATAFRPGEADDQVGPGRAIGVAWLPIDKAIHRLDIAMTVPEVTLPRGPVEIPIQVSGAEGEAFITLAAVDEGILDLTEFATPDPLEHYFGKKRLGVDIRDLYGRLIDGAAGRRGEVRVGGDADMSRRSAPPEIKLVALFSGLVPLDEDGRAIVRFDLPDYNGRLRLMAVAYDRTKVGSAETGLIVRDPLVSIIASPRFLAPGDRSTITLSLQNLDAPEGSYRVSLTSDAPLQLGDGATFERSLVKGESAVVAIPVLGQSVGVGTLHLTVAGPDGYSLVRDVTLAVRPARLPTVEREISQIAPGSSLVLDSALVAGYQPGSAELLATVSADLDLDMAGILRELDRYPYGCLEQTTSRAMPLLYVADIAQSLGLVENEARLSKNIERAILRVVDMQSWDGGFSLWGGGDYTERWLSAYAMDFLTRAKAKGFLVPQIAYENGLDWLEYYLSDHSADSESDLSARAYAAYVLASAGVADAGLLRHFYDNEQARIPSSFAMVQLGTALALIGDQTRAAAAFDRVRSRTFGFIDYDAYDYYASNLRNMAAMIAIAAEHRISELDYGSWVATLMRDIRKERYLNTQEQSWMVLAAAALANRSEMSLAIDGGEAATQTGAYYRRLAEAQLATPTVISNAGTAPIWATVTKVGVPSDPQAAVVSNGITVTRRYYDLDGNEIALDRVQQNDVIVVVATIDDRSHDSSQSVYVDLLPAGFELENMRLADARQTEQYGWLPELSYLSYQEYLDDRYIAAFESDGNTWRSIAYMMRATTPGRYRVPAAVVEDMYDAGRYGNDAASEVEIVAAP